MDAKSKYPDDDKNLDFMKRVEDAVALIFGPQCETLVSDNNDPTHSVLHINNGQVTGRQVGSPVSGLGIKKIRSGNFDEDMVNYIVRTQDGRVLKCASIYFTDENISYSLGVNFDYTNIVNALTTLSNLAQNNTEMEDEYSNNPNLILSNMFNEALKTVNRPLTQLNKEDKRKIVQLLDDMGAFLLRHGVVFVAEKLDISRYTVYNYIKKTGSKE